MRDHFLTECGEGVHELTLVVINTLVKGPLLTHSIDRDTTNNFSQASGMK
jgi:hypothetical protein